MEFAFELVGIMILIGVIFSAYWILITQANFIVLRLGLIGMFLGIPLIDSLLAGRNLLTGER